MRLGVLDIGSNTVNLLVSEARQGARPVTTTSHRSILRLMRYLEPDGSLSEAGISALETAVTEARAVADAEHVSALLTIATSALREAPNGADAIARVEAITGVPLQVLDGPGEARFTFLAIRRWFGWSAGEILMLDIGGGSLEVAAGIDEVPDVALSLPLGAGRVTVGYLPDDPPTEAQLGALRAHVREQLAPVVAAMRGRAYPDHVVGSSKTIRSLARLAGTSVPGWAESERMILSRAALKDWIPRMAAMPAEARQQLPGITPERTFQIVGGAVVLHAAMKALDVDELEVSPWALREGVLLRYLETLD
ncbi:Ppx/GppA phosphatase family protein [Microbacterium sp. CJ88]|uniref:Ppx/GppA phosphatase family protein n=1 Tax=Microbacterium sp. CJ88 TaxID=3445672 RepID=UPI003F6569B4